jgi:hypothetical protein
MREWSDAALVELLSGARTIAVVGAKQDEAEDAFRVPTYLARRGYRVIAVNPKLSGWSGQPAYPSLSAVPEPIDLVNVFRAAEHVPAHVPEIAALAPRPRAVWLQLGIRNDAAAEALEGAGIAVVQDRCIMVDHRRLLGAA